LTDSEVTAREIRRDFESNIAAINAESERLSEESVQLDEINYNAEHLAVAGVEDERE